MPVLGSFFGIYIGGQRVALATSGNTNIKTLFEDTTNNDSGGFMQIQPTQNNLTAGIEAIYTSAIGNSLQWPEDFSNAAWTKTAVTVNGTKVDNHNGQLLAQVLSMPTTRSVLQVVAIPVGAQYYTASVWLKTGTATLKITHSGGATASLIIGSASWTRYQIALPSTVSGGTVTLELYNHTGGTITPSVFGPQINSGNVATDYIGSTVLASQLAATEIAGTPVVIRYSNDISGDFQSQGNAYLSNLQFKTKTTGIVTFTADLTSTGIQAVTTI